MNIINIELRLSKCVRLPLTWTYLSFFYCCGLPLLEKLRLPLSVREFHSNKKYFRFFLKVEKSFSIDSVLGPLKVVLKLFEIDAISMQTTQWICCHTQRKLSSCFNHNINSTLSNLCYPTNKTIYVRQLSQERILEL